jgi:hypothetical protein
VISEDDRRRLNESLSTVAEHIDWDDWSEQAQALHVRKYGDADRV